MTGYILKGSSYIQCQRDFTWDLPVPVCKPGFYVSAAIGFGSLVGALLLLVISGAFCIVVSKRNRVKYVLTNSKLNESPHSQGEQCNI
ncbi:complement receptor type 2 [Rhineura floridana]|uniref:complement receptor type 2 n=1 Tax=Rhineura floridana TaxID=261503 RepID=UPI002AC7FEC2|nr:complement receptor type 2 [Rhineura floridana]